MFPFTRQEGVIRKVNTNIAAGEGNEPGKVREVVNSDGTLRYEAWLYNGTGAALTAGRPYYVTYGAIATPLKAAVPATLAAPAMVVFPITALADADWGWFAFAGEVKDLVLVTATAIALGDPLEVINAGVTLIEDAARGVGTVAIAREASSAGGSVALDVYLPGVPVEIAAV